MKRRITVFRLSAQSILRIWFVIYVVVVEVIIDGRFINGRI